MSSADLCLWALGLAIVAVWWPKRVGPCPAWAMAAGVSMLAGLWGGVINGWAMAAVALFMAVGCRGRSPASSTLPAWRAAILGLMALALALHAFPGFHRVPIFDAIRLSPDAPAFALFASVDKALAGLGLLVGVCLRCSRWSEAWTMLKQSWAILLMTVISVLGLGWASHAVAWDPKWPVQAPAFLAVNLLFTCVAEEAFFRGFLQARLAQMLTHPLRGSAVGGYLAALISAALFGAVHLGGGWAFALLAGLAGMGYGLAYARTHKIEAAILTHIAVNATHFLLFTYPARA